MQNNINVGSENESKITDTHGGRGVVSKINKSKVVPVFAVMVMPKYDVVDLVKMLAVNKYPPTTQSCGWPVVMVSRWS